MKVDLSKLPEAKFVTADKEKVVEYITKSYEKITGRTLADGDPIRLFILTMSYVVIMLLNKINETGKQNLAKYATGANLDNLAAGYGLTRKQASRAVTTVQFTKSDSAREVIIPLGTRVSRSGEQVYFATNEELKIPIGTLSGTVLCQCVAQGTTGNGYAPGTLTNLVDPAPYIDSVTNKTASEGGTDTESDDDLRHRYILAPESFSVAGPSGAYEYFALEANQSIGTAKAVSSSPGCVDIYLLGKNGKIVGESLQKEVLGYISADNRRPLTDKVSVKAPTMVPYDINLTYYINADDVAQMESIKAKVNKAITTYQTWQDTIFGRDINPDKLIQLVMDAGAKRVVVASPTYTHVAGGGESDSYTVGLAQVGKITVTYGGLEDE